MTDIADFIQTASESLGAPALSNIAGTDGRNQSGATGFTGALQAENMRTIAAGSRTMYSRIPGCRFLSLQRLARLFLQRSATDNKL